MFEARCESTKLLVSFLQTLLISTPAATPAHSRNKLCTIYASTDSITIRTQNPSRTCHASINLTRTAFDHLTVDESTASEGFCLNLTILLDCLHVLGSTNLDRTRCLLSYDQESAILTVELYVLATHVSDAR